MRYQFARQLHSTWQQWRSAPLWSAWLLLLASIVMVSGPWACVVHCMILDSTHQAHTLRAEAHAVHGSTSDHAQMHNAVDHTAAPQAAEPARANVCDQTAHNHAQAAPSALTIAVLLPLLLVPHLGAITIRQSRQRPIVYAWPLPPPRHPPRLSIQVFAR